MTAAAQELAAIEAAAMLGDGADAETTIKLIRSMDAWRIFADARDAETKRLTELIDVWRGVHMAAWNRAQAAEESARDWEASCREAYADAGSAEYAERTYGAALQQIKAVCENNAQVSRPDLALKFILGVVMKTLHGEPAADPEAV